MKNVRIHKDQFKKELMADKKICISANSNEYWALL